MTKSKTKRYQLRNAAGAWWLLDMEQQGISYQKPCILNESGAYFWGLLEKGYTEEQIAAHLEEEFFLSKEEARRDTNLFLNQLRQQNIQVFDQ